MLRSLMVISLALTPALALAQTKTSALPPARATDMGQPTLLIPPSSIGIDLCLGELSGAYGSPMLAITLSAPQRDRVCSLLRESKWAADLQEPALAREIMCNSPDWRAAAKRVGRPCSADRPKEP